MRIRRTLLAFALGTVVAAAPAAGYAGAPADPGPAPEGTWSTAGLDPEEWVAYEQPEWSAPAGTACDFPLALDVIEQDLESRVLERYDDGAVKLEEYRGPLLADLVNVDTGERARHDASGRAVAEYYPNGEMKTYAMIGPVGIGLHNDYAELEKSYYIVDGFHVVTYAKDGTMAMPVRIGTQTDVCAELT